MTIREIVSQGLHYARTCKSLWLFGFFVGAASGGSSAGGSGRGGGGGGGGSVVAGVGGFLGLSVPEIALLAVVIILAVVVSFVMRLLSEGALIEGVVRARQGGR